MRLRFTILAAIIAIVVGLISFYIWDSNKNHGLTFGYWGEFNTVSNALASLEGVKVIRGDGNQDVTFEEMAFEIQTHGQTVRLFFSETTPVRSMNGQKLREALVKLIAKELAMQTNSPQL